MVNLPNGVQMFLLWFSFLDFKSDFNDWKSVTMDAWDLLADNALLNMCPTSLSCQEGEDLTYWEGYVPMSKVNFFDISHALHLSLSAPTVLP